MRVMVMVKANEDSEAGVMPSTELLTAMGKYNEELVKAGVMLAGEGLHPSSKGKRVRFSGADRTVIDGPFAETKELIAGFWIFQVKCMDEAVEWVKRCPNPMAGESEIEIRQVFEAEDFGDQLTPELREQEERLRADASRPKRRASSARWPRRHADPAGDRGRLADRVRPADRRPDQIVRDVGLAEDLAQDALVAALEQWPRVRRPGQPGRLADGHGEAPRDRRDAPRRDARAQARSRSAASWRPAAEAPDLAAGNDDDVGDDLLGWCFMTCHPVLVDGGPGGADAAAARRPDDGGDRARVPRPEATVQQRIVRAKRTLAEARVPFEIPRGDELSARLPAVLEVIYLVFNEGYSATAGDDWVRPALCEDALRLGRMLAGLVPREPEVHGLVALMELQASRLGARVGPAASRCCCSTRTARAGTGC